MNPGGGNAVQITLNWSRSMWLDWERDTQLICLIYTEETVLQLLAADWSVLFSSQRSLAGHKTEHHQDTVLGTRKSQSNLHSQGWKVLDDFQYEPVRHIWPFKPSKPNPPVHEFLTKDLWVGRLSVHVLWAFLKGQWERHEVYFNCQKILKYCMWMCSETNIKSFALKQKNRFLLFQYYSDF